MTSVNDLANEIVRQVAAYTREVEEKVDQAADDVTKESVNNLKTAGGFDDQSGDYRKGWKRKKINGVWVIYNKKYQLTHLLERGHAIAGGTGRSRTFPHIGPEEQKAISEFTDRVERAIRK
ncbi:HK97 gp10 family phage protein [Bacillus multifaciens]|uniref:HK97 gp10 family phage protein n=1 Tax=Bacillus multifaciens TaxID=3068506 RepID=UPI002740A1D3|nr:HK97 gp10 family phage protein [Bacillus sp. WLY-B-L8]MDP7981522.1 HK97 gp10 family phage protein [Bacillus sp. WLY-B-L8]